VHQPWTRDARATAQAIALAFLAGCGAASLDSAPPSERPVASIAAELDALSGDLPAASRATFREILADTLAKDAYLCRPSARAVLLGNRRLMAERGIEVGELEARAAELAGAGRTPMFVAVDGAAAGLLAVADEVKPESREAVRRLKAMGLEVLMLTGDNRRTAEAVAREVGVDRVLAEVLPEGKAEEIRRLQAEGRVVAMVGDGINDAPALAQADIGISIGTGTDVALEASDVTLIRGDLRGVVTAVALSRATMRTIRQNLFWAFAYNVVGIPVAAGLLYPFTGWLLSPIIASAAMSLSSVSVVTNSLRLRRFRAPHAS